MKNKIMIIIGLLGIIIPFNAKALTGSVNLSCSSTRLKPGEKTNCTINANIKEEVSSLNMKLELGENLSLVSIKTDDSWQGDGDGGDITLYTGDNKQGQFPIATFTVQANSINTGSDSEIKLTSVKLYADANNEFAETVFNINPLKIRVQSTINTLKSLTIDGESISGFSPNITTYNLTVDSNKKNININAIATDSEHSTISGDLGVKTLNYGINTFTVKVKSETGVEKKYNIVVTRPESRELKSLSINNNDIKLTSGTYQYNYSVEKEISNIDIKAELSNSTDVTFVENFGSRKVALNEGINEILIKIKDNNGEMLIYKIIINKLTTENETTENETNKNQNSEVSQTPNGTEDKKTDTVEDKEEVKSENPSTWGGISSIIFVSVIIIGGGIFLIIRKYSKFPKKM